MEGILQKSTSVQAPVPQSPFEAYVIHMLSQNGPIFHSINDLSESIQFLASQMVTKDELEEKLTNYPTKTDLAAAEYRIKVYVDNSVLTNKDFVIPLVRKEDEKVDCIINVLEDESVIKTKKSRELKSMGPFGLRV